MDKYLDLKQKQNLNRENFCFKKWYKCMYNDYIMKDVIWLSDSGDTFIKECEFNKNEFTLKQTYVHLESKKSVETIMMEHNDNYDYYIIVFGNDINLFLRIKKNLINDDTGDLLMFNVYRYMKELNIISNTKNEEFVLPLIDILNTINIKKIYFIDKENYEVLLNNTNDLLIHWVWFRKNNNKLSNEISKRSLSWIIINPTSKFHLWTNLKNLDEWHEFMSDIDENIKTIFNANICVHYENETIELYNGVMKEYMESNYYDANSYEFLNREFFSQSKCSLIFKTDFIRLMILYKYGGMYTDFNDCLCLAPIKILFTIHDLNIPLGVSDSNDVNHASNYFLYSPKENNIWKNIMFEMILDVKHIIYFLKNEEIKIKIKNICTDVYTKMCENFCIDNDNTKYIELNNIYETNFKKIKYFENKSRNISIKLWKILVYSIIHNLSCYQNDERNICSIIYDLKKNKNINDKIYEKVNFNSDEFEKNFAFVFDLWWTDYTLNTLMHYTNLPIYCRLKKYDLLLVPFGYYNRYCCLLSFVGHLGDGGSYGLDNSKSLSVNSIYV